VKFDTGFIKIEFTEILLQIKSSRFENIKTGFFQLFLNFHIKLIISSLWEGSPNFKLQLKYLFVILAAFFIK
jgi:hypothetical protein